MLIDASGNVVERTKTNDNGEYVFDTLKQGSYTVLFSHMDSAAWSTHNNTTTDTNNDVVNNDGETNVINITGSALNVTNIDAGVTNELTTSISIVKGMDDSNGNISNSITHERNSNIDVTFKITNTGTEKLVDVNITDKTTVGRDNVENIVCEYRKETINGIERNVLDAGETVECSGVLNIRDISVNNEASHADVATVTATGAYTLKNVTDDDTFSVVTTANVGNGEETGESIVNRIPATGSIVATVVAISVIMLLGSGVSVMRTAKEEE